MRAEAEALEAGTKTVTLPPGVGFDPGGAGLLAGATYGPALIDALDTAGLVVRDDSDVIITHDFERFT